MRATTFFSGLLLTTAVIAAPAPRQGQDISDSNPFNVDSRRGVSVIGTLEGGVTKVETTVESLGVGIPKIPTRRQVSDVTGTVKDVETTIETKVGALGLTNDLPVRQLEGVTTAVTSAVSPEVNLVTSLLSSALTSLTSADASVQTLITDAQANAADIVSEIEADLTSGQSELTSLIASLEGSSATAEVVSLVSQVKTTANTLLLDLEKVEDSVPGVSSLISIVKGIIAEISSFGL